MEEKEESIRLIVYINQDVNFLLFELMKFYRELNRSAVVRRAIKELFEKEKEKMGGKL